MAYPKPLSQKTLEKMYSGLKPETMEFLHHFFRAASNLYGIVCLEDLFGIYKDLFVKRNEAGLEDKKYVKDITWNEFVDFSSVVRRDGNVPYFIYELSEVYSAEKDAMEERLLINKELLHKGYYKFGFTDSLIRTQGDKPFYVPQNFLDFEKHILSPEEKKLLKFFENLKSTAKEVPVYIDRENDHTDFYSWNTNKGRYLKNIHNIVGFDACMVRAFGGFNKLPYFENKRLFTEDGDLRNFAEQLLFHCVFLAKSCVLMPNELIQDTEMWLSEMGVELSNKQLGEYLELIMNFNNNLRTWGNRGFTPDELFHINMQKNPNMVPKINFGDGYKKMFEEGNFSIEELRQKVFDDEKLTLPLKKSILDGLNDLEKKM